PARRATRRRGAAARRDAVDCPAARARAVREWAMRFALLFSSACSFVLVHGPDRAPGAPPSCTAMPVAPAVDTAFVAAGVIAAVTAQQKLGDHTQDFPNNDFLRMQRD